MAFVTAIFQNVMRTGWANFRGVRPYTHQGREGLEGHYPARAAPRRFFLPRVAHCLLRTEGNKEYFVAIQGGIRTWPAPPKRVPCASTGALRRAYQVLPTHTVCDWEQP